MRFLTTLLLLTFVVACANTSVAQEVAGEKAATSRTTAPPASAKLPTCPTGVTHVAWNDFFVLPIGRDGLELTPKIKSLDGKRVRLLGYMVRREEALPGVLILTPFPTSVEEQESGFADLPPQAVRVILPYAAKEQIPYTSRPLLLTGILSVGRREESGEAASGSVSWFRLTLDTPDPVAPGNAAKSKVEPSATDPKQ